MDIMMRFGTYRSIFNGATEFSGHQHDNTASDRVHLFLHQIFDLAPAILAAVIVFLVPRVTLNSARRGKFASRQAQSRPIRGLEHSLFKTVPGYPGTRQAFMIMMSLISMPILYLTLEHPKRIVNSAPEADRFPSQLVGYYFDEVTILMVLSGLSLLAINVNGLGKGVLNVFNGKVVKRFYWNFRLPVYRDRYTDFQWQAQSEIAPILAREVEPVWGRQRMCAICRSRRSSFVYRWGYFAVQGRINPGAPVAVLAAHEDSSAPSKELFRYHQTFEGTRIRYHEITSGFSDEIRSEHLNEPGGLSLVPALV